MHTSSMDDDDTSQDEMPMKRRKRDYVTVLDDPDDDLPYHYRHTRAGERSIKDDIWKLYVHLGTKFHMTGIQIQGSVAATMNTLAGRTKYGKWKMHTDDDVIDNNTLPAWSNTQRIEKYTEAMALSLIVDEMMNSDGSGNCIVYSNDGSAQSGVGNYVVQSLTINKVKRSLPTF